MGKYGCVLQAMVMMLVALAAMGLYEYGQTLPAAALGLIALGVMGWGLWIVNRKSSGD
jgi:hypothetical protein